MTVTQPPVQTRETQSALTPAEALEHLREGNRRFREGRPVARDLFAQVNATASGQYPFAIVLGCVDSRVPIETVFDQGIGDVFTARVAGNVINPDLLGSMEFACKLAGAKAILVLGHTSCGAVKGAMAGAELGNLTGLLGKIAPAVREVAPDGADPGDLPVVDAVAERNVHRTIDAIRCDSPVLEGLEKEGGIVIQGAMYDVASGEVRFL